MEQPVAPFHLIGYRYCVYTRIVRMALADTSAETNYTEVNLFETAGAEQLSAWHPFARVPVLEHGPVRLFETGAILVYLAAMEQGVSLSPQTAIGQARAAQVIGLVDTYGYWPLVRQVFGHGVFRPRFGLESDPKEVAAGLAASGRVLDALEEIATEGHILNGRAFTIADCHLAPMVDYFCEHEGGRKMLGSRTALSAWFTWVAEHASFQETRPTFPERAR